MIVPPRRHPKKQFRQATARWSCYLADYYTGCLARPNNAVAIVPPLAAAVHLVSRLVDEFVKSCSPGCVSTVTYPTELGPSWLPQSNSGHLARIIFSRQPPRRLLLKPKVLCQKAWVGIIFCQRGERHFPLPCDAAKPLDVLARRVKSAFGIKNGPRPVVKCR